MGFQRVTFCAETGEEVVVHAAELVTSSLVWRERLNLSPPDGDDEMIRSVEKNVSYFEMESFVSLLTLLSARPSKPDLLHPAPNSGSSGRSDVFRWSEPDLLHSAPNSGSSGRSDVFRWSECCIRRLGAALTLVHKYDCPGLLAMIVHLARPCFFECRAACRGRADVSTLPFAPLSEWLTQAHLDYIVRMQELYWALDEQEEEQSIMPLLTSLHLGLLAQALTMGIAWTVSTRFANGVHYVHGRVDVVSRKASSDSPPPAVQPSTVQEPADQPDASKIRDLCGRFVKVQRFDRLIDALYVELEPLVIEQQRLAPRTLRAVLSFVIPRGCMAITAESVAVPVEPKGTHHSSADADGRAHRA